MRVLTRALDQSVEVVEAGRGGERGRPRRLAIHNASRGGQCGRGRAEPAETRQRVVDLTITWNDDCEVVVVGDNGRRRRAENDLQQHGRADPAEGSGSWPDLEV